jgi:hypothetical protein
VFLILPPSHQNVGQGGAISGNYLELRAYVAVAAQIQNRDDEKNPNHDDPIPSGLSDTLAQAF